MRIRNIVAIAAFAIAGTAGAQTKWDLATAFVPNNFHVENLSRFAADIDKATSGSLKINIHANSSLFKGNEIKRAVQGGQVQAGEILMVAYENESPVLGVDGVPFLATGYKNARSLYQAQKPYLEKYLEKQGIVLLYCVPWPASGLYSKKPVDALADMRRVKWRAYSPATARMGELMGAQPVTIQASELSQALATGGVEAFMTSSQTGVDSRVYEQVKYFYDLRIALPKNAVFVNAAAFNALDKTQQAAVKAAAAKAEERGWTLSHDWDEASKKTLAAKNMVVAEPSSKLVSDFKQLGWTILQEWQKKAGAEGEAIVQAYLKAPVEAVTPTPASKAATATPVARK
ncbi:MAG: TRAP transporter substrate-binding protein [Ramlibacter sp.]|nr:TRAP transporter substrate-binding protein [Ramlibacter sp.]